MSIIKAGVIQSGISLDTANNMLLDASADDGTFELKREDGSPIISVDSSNNVSFNAGAEPISDYEDIDASGWFACSASSVLNGPETASYQHSIFATKNSIGLTFIVSRITGNGANHKSWIGSRPTGSTIIWTEVYTQSSILGEVSQSEGIPVGEIPTGAIIERGSNTNGEYIKFADGTQICFGVAGSTTPQTATGTLFRSASFTWTYPVAFDGTPWGNYQPDSSTRWGGCNTSVSSFSWYMWSPTSSSTSTGGFLVAIGRWYTI